ncbi:MAG: hypothetical protein QM763_13495 [Agriterribacter sp.]
MKPVYLYTIISLIIAMIIALLFIRFPFFNIETVSDLGTGMPRRYYDYSNSLNEAEERQQSFPYILNAVLYLVVQFFVFRSIKSVYGSFIRGRIILYIVFVILTAPFIVFPYFFLKSINRMFVAGLNPFLNQLIYIPVYYQAWIWADIIIRILLAKPKTGSIVE